MRHLRVGGAWPAAVVAALLVATTASATIAVRMTTDDQNPPTARLGILQDVVEARSPGSDFAPATDAQELGVGHAVRTDDTGRARIDYPDGSLTRLEATQTFSLVDLVDAPPGRTRTELDIGRTWHRVRELTGSDDRFEVSTPVATATVRGTVFTVVCAEDRSCVFTVIEGVVEITPLQGDSFVLETFQQVTVGPDGVPGAVETLTEEELLSDPWIAANMELDGMPADQEPAPDQAPTASPARDGKIAYVDEGRIWVLEADGSRRAITAPHAPNLEPPRHPRWSPDGTRLAWIEWTDIRSPSIVVAAADGSGRREIVEVTRFCVSAPAWSPDGSTLASSTCRLGAGSHGEIFTVAVAGGPPTVIPTPRGASAPSFSPDGTQVVFEDRPDPGTYPSHLDDRDEWDLGVVALDGSGYRRIGAGRPQQERWEPAGPVWSPAGDEIAYFFEASSSTCARHVRIINTDGTGEREVAAPDQEARICGRELPSWNADGSMLAFSYCDVGTETTPPACHLGVAGSEPGAAARRILQLSDDDTGGAGYPDWHGTTVPGSG